MTFYWNEKTWAEVQQQKPDVVLLPVGSVEAHGPHLPLSTDSIISDEVARRAAAQLQEHGIQALILPPLHYVVTDFSKDFPGTISISKESFQAILRDIAGALQQQGINTFCIVNSHLEPAHIQAIDEFCNHDHGMKILFPDKTKKPWALQLTEEFKKGACHAGSYETSLVLASRPELVKEERKQLKPLQVNLAVLMKQGVRGFREAGATEAYFGDPAAATQQEGEMIYSILTRMVVEAVLKKQKTSHLSKKLE